MTAADPQVRTHSVRCVYVRLTMPVWRCRGCGQKWDFDTSASAIERLPCGTRDQKAVT